MLARLLSPVPSALPRGTVPTAYNGMLRVQNGLGRLKQSAYLKFSATGNKIVDESEVLLQESVSAKGPISVAISNSVVDNAKHCHHREGKGPIRCPC